MNKSKYEKKYIKHYNYSGGIRCNDIKPIERKFFKYLMRQVDYEEIQKYQTLETVTLNRAVICYCKIFAEKYNVPIGQLVYYLDKWNRRGIYDYDTSIGYGRFNLTKVFKGELEQYEIYREMMPSRTCRFIIKALNNSFGRVEKVSEKDYKAFCEAIKLRMTSINSIINYDEIDKSKRREEMDYLMDKLNRMVNESCKNKEVNADNLKFAINEVLQYTIPGDFEFSYDKNSNELIVHVTSVNNVKIYQLLKYKDGGYVSKIRNRLDAGVLDNTRYSYNLYI